VLKQSDYISLHVPGGEATKHMISTAQFEMMKPTACIINCARGGVIDEKALLAALEAGKIRGAGFDVYEEEPLATDKLIKDPVVNHPMIYGTHHIGASTEQAQLAGAEETVRIVKVYKETGEVINCVN
ncbi:MAG: NAD(P)-dependent oxidoreductase, partial [bacterium]